MLPNGGLFVPTLRHVIAEPSTRHEDSNGQVQPAARGAAGAAGSAMLSGQVIHPPPSLTLFPPHCYNPTSSGSPDSP